MIIVKQYFAKVYTPTINGTGGDFIKEDYDFVFPDSGTAFSWALNGGLGECTLRFARNTENFGENDDIALYNQIDIYVLDKESGDSGQIVYSGYIIEYIPTLDGADEYVDVTLWGYGTELGQKVLENAGSTTLDYNSQDPSDILTDLMTHFDGKVQAGFINTTSTVVNYEFKQNTFLDAINQCVTLSPAWWYWRVGADNLIYFDIRSTTQVDHYLTVGKDIQKLTLTRSAKTLVNKLYFLGGGTPQLYVEKTHSSTSDYGVRAAAQQDERVTEQSTAQIITDSYLNIWDHPSILASCIVADSNGGSGGYDIESFKPGQIVRINDPQFDVEDTLWDVAEWDVGYWDFSITSAIGVPFMITNIDYQLDQATLQLAYLTYDGSKRIQDIKRNLYFYRTANSPSTPTSV